MTLILPSYTITNETLALIPARTIEYSTIVLEQTQQYLIRQTPLEVIKSSCIDYWTTYEGSRLATINHTGFKQKTPIPIDQQHHIIAFPTHSPKHHDCHWIIYNQHLKIISHQKQATLNINHEHTITLNISTHTLQNQIERAFIIYYKIKQHKTGQKAHLTTLTY